MMLAGWLKMTLGEMRERMSASEFALWQEYFFIHPFGHESNAIADLTAVVANSNPFRDKDSRVFQREDFLPQPAAPARDDQSTQEQLAFADAIVTALGGAGSR